MSEYFGNIIEKVMAQGDRHGLTLDDYAGLLAWAKEHEPVLHADETRLMDELNAAPDEQAIKKATLAYGKTLIKMFEAFAKWKEKKAAAAPARRPEPPKRYEPAQGRLI